MDDPEKKILNKQGSLSYIEQSLKMIPPPQQAPVTIYPGPKPGSGNLSKADLEIANRLEKLRKKDTKVPTEEEMASRLAQLKGLPEDYYTKPSSKLYQPPDRRTEVEKSEDLLKQVLEEVALDIKVPKPEDEIEARLARLRGVEKPKFVPTEAISFSGAASSPLESTGSDEIVQLMKQAEAETFKEAKMSLKSLKDDKAVSEAIGLPRKQTKHMKHRSKTAKIAKKGSSTSSDEKYSASDDSEMETKAKKSNEKGSQKEKKEIDRIVQMYTKEAEEKKEKKRLKKLAKKKVQGSSNLSSNSELSSTSDSTSDSEKFSSGSD